ncbi:MAG TPA: hypothetical protein VNK95_19295 [Caldilineaceae bacterium]|nr:hypothetical protein [Caldilineaceae bacterium]
MSILAVAVLAACGGAPTPESAAALARAAAFDTPMPNQIEAHTHTGEESTDHVHLDAAEITEEMEAAIVPSELTIGPNRFAVGLFDANGQVVRDAKVHFHYYDLTNPQAPTLESHAEAVRLQTPDGTTVFAHEREFTRAGDWGVEIQARFADGRAAIKRISFTVLAESPTLKPGEVAPAADTPTLASGASDLSQLTSAPSPNPALYNISLAEALANDLPTVLLFATPAFCQTRFCGPAYELFSELQQRYQGRANFIHVEVYTGLPNPASNNWEIAPAMAAFGLSTEPWLYLLDADGIVVYRVEGLFTTEEVERHLQALLG